MFGSVKISPSVLSADFMNMEASIRGIEEGADLIHVDVMDGHFVPNLSIGVPFVKQLKAISSLPLDVHLMISNPLTQLPWFLDIRPDRISVHIEAFTHKEEVAEALQLIDSAGVAPALALKPATPIEVLRPFVGFVDMILVMSVNPGFSGQSYIAGSELRVAEVVRMASSAGATPLIQVDGGIDLATAGLVVAEGADVLVAGNAVFGKGDPLHAIAALRQEAINAQR